MASGKLRTKKAGGTPHGDRIRRARELLELSQDKVADRGGLARNVMSVIETGGHMLTTANIRAKLSKGFQVPLATMEELIEGAISPEAFVGIAKGIINVSNELPAARVEAMLGELADRIDYDREWLLELVGERGRTLDDLPAKVRRAVVGVAVVMGQPIEAVSAVARAVQAKAKGADFEADQWFALIKNEIPPRPPSGTHIAIKKVR